MLHAVNPLQEGLKVRILARHPVFLPHSQTAVLSTSCIQQQQSATVADLPPASEPKEAWSGLHEEITI